MLAVIFFLLAMICFVLAAFKVTARIELVAIGLACFTVPFLVQAWPG